MRPADPPPGPASVLRSAVLGSACLLSLACVDRPLAPHQNGGPSLSEAGEVPLPPPVTYSIPVPSSTAINFGDAPLAPVVTVREGFWFYRAFVSGTVTVWSNPVCTGSPSEPAYTTGPGGPFSVMDRDYEMTQALAVHIAHRDDRTGEIYDDSYVGASAPMLVPTAVTDRSVVGPATIMIGRSGLPYSWCTDRDGVRFWTALSGSQTATITFMALAVKPSVTLTTAGARVEFTTRATNATYVQYSWYWVPPGAPPTGEGNATLIPECEGKDACTYAPPQTGRMRVQALADGLFGGYVWGVSPDVEVRQSPTEPVEIVIREAKGPNPGGSFTRLAGEREITLRADVLPAELAPYVEWEVLDDPDDEVPSIAPDEVEPGAASKFIVPAQDLGRWRRFKHAESRPLSRKSLAFRVVAWVVRDETQYVSEPVTVKQDDIDTMREEYIEFRLDRVPARGEFTLFGPTYNGGDYAKGILNSRFHLRLVELEQLWKTLSPNWFVNVIYRNPVHNLIHVPEQTNSSGASPKSWHMWGCAADLQTFPRLPRDTPERKLQAVIYWEMLAAEARELLFDVEERVRKPGVEFASGVGHVHVELNCP